MRQSNLLRLGWQRHLGPYAWLALPLWAAVVWLHASLTPGLAREQAQLQRARTTLLQSKAAQPVEARPDPGTAWLERLPAHTDQGATVGRLLSLLNGSGVTVDSADYTLEPQEPGLLRLRVKMPVRGSYPKLRRLLAKLLNEVPHAALDSFSVERDADTDAELSGQLQISFFFRQVTP